MKQPEYTEGTQALENFKQLATAILQAPAKKKNRQTKKSASHLSASIGCTFVARLAGK
jgi:hypothetical protein